MVLVCKDCKRGIAIAKYYPQQKGTPLLDDGAGWGQYPLNKNRVNEFFALHQHDYDTSFGGGDQYDLRYELDDNTWKYEDEKNFSDYDETEYQPLENFGEPKK